ncbi:MAG: transposase [Planctomycetaceae bacterium]|nr:transposase [Planctomycetaceae bacterium]
MANHLPREKQLTILHLLLEGNSVRSVVRLTGSDIKTVLRVMVRFGEGCQVFLDSALKNLKLRHVQIDEIWTFVQKKQGHLNEWEKRDDSIGDQYLFLALDTDSKLIASYTLGKRNGGNAYGLLADLRSRTECVTQISTDGFPAYPDVVRDTFRGDTCHGVLIKSYAEPNSGRYAPPELIATNRLDLGGINDKRTICTSHIERCNLTIRTFMRRFTRLALGFSKKKENLAAAIAMHIAHYNFCRIHGTLKCTPAMAASVTGKLWSLPDLFDAVAAEQTRRLKAASVKRLLARMQAVLG